jgi:hypothetical protein
MAKYRKKPVVIEAFRLEMGERAPEWFEEALLRGGISINIYTLETHIKTLEGTMRAVQGDWIIQGVKGEIYPCKPDIFEATYEPVGEKG